MDQFAASGRFSREEEADEEQEDASNSMREISFMPAAASASGSASTSASASAASGSSIAAPFRSASGDAAGASGSGGGGGGAADVEAVEKEHMFDKVVTPSDVGKLNRLVIPKQHAERYFPLSGDSGEKGLILSFEDEAGKPWRFRYSYWTSSQSYVLTKGWSRYVKEKQLDAGDVVHFERMRGFGLGDRLFISYRRRGESATVAVAPPPPAVRVVAPAQSTGGEQQPWSPMCYSTSGSYPTSPANSHAYRHSVDHDHSNMQHAGQRLITKSKER